MFKIIVLCLFLTSFSVLATDVRASQAEAEQVQAMIQHAGYECDRVDHVKTDISRFFETTSNVVCDKVFRFILRYQRGGVSVEVE